MVELEKILSNLIWGKEVLSVSLAALIPTSMPLKNSL